MLGLGNWYSVPDGNMQVRRMLDRHYSANRYSDGRKVRLSAGPGEKMVLMTVDARAMFIWRKFIDASGQIGINCAAFRNEAPEIYLSSDLILEAEQLAWGRWPGERLYTYVDARKVKSSNPGYCFIVAGWKKCGVTKSGKMILEKLHD